MQTKIKGGAENEGPGSLVRIVGWANARAISPRYRGTPHFPLRIYRTQSEAKSEFGLDAVRVAIIPATEASARTVGRRNGGAERKH